MAKILFVSPKAKQWMVHWEERQGAIYSNKNEAIIAAKKLVEQLPEGTVSQIRVQKDDGTGKAEWTYGKDPFPKQG